MSLSESLEEVPGNIQGRRLSSAYLSIQIPFKNTSDSLATCSVDARWIKGRISGSAMAQWLGSESYNASVLADGQDWPWTAYQFPALNSTRWRVVRLGLD